MYVHVCTCKYMYIGMYAGDNLAAFVHSNDEEENLAGVFKGG